MHSSLAEKNVCEELRRRRKESEGKNNYNDEQVNDGEKKVTSEWINEIQWWSEE